jgi:hypothetical protein
LAVRPAPPASAFPVSKSWRGTAAAGQARRRRRRKQRPSAGHRYLATGTSTDPAHASSTVSKAAGCLACSRRIPMPALRARADANQAHSCSRASGRCSHGASSVIGGLHQQPAALGGASDRDSRPAGRRPRPFALCCRNAATDPSASGVHLPNPRATADVRRRLLGTSRCLACSSALRLASHRDRCRRHPRSPDF